MDIVIVDDQPSARTILRHIIQDIAPQLAIYDFGEPEKALQWCSEHVPDLLLLDYRMPGMDGLQLARRFRRTLCNRDVPIVLVSVVSDEPIRQAALDAGCIDVLVKPIRPRELRARCRNLLQLRQQSESVKQRALSLEQRLLASRHELEERERETLSRLASALESRYTGTTVYLQRMACVAQLIAQGLGLPDDMVRGIGLAAPLHDIGKIAIPDALLMKPGPLNEHERQRMQRHPNIGYELLQGSDSKFVQISAKIARHHHENYDGTGYPDGLVGRDIPIEARVVTVADVFDALISPRPYRKPIGIERALDVIAAQSGKMLDPDCVRALLDNGSRLHQLCDRYSNNDPQSVALASDRDLS